MTSQPAEVLNTPPATSHLTAIDAACCLGNSLAECKSALRSGATGLKPLSQLQVIPGLENLLAGWIPDRALLGGRRYGVASNAALHVARNAVAQAGWDSEQCSEAWIFAGTSRGNVAEAFGHTTFRRPAPKFSASNSLPSEIPAAISIELGMFGPWQLLSNACCAGLDALGLAHMAITSGATTRALVVAVELPLVPELLRSFQATGLLARDPRNDPYHPQTNGLLPAEAAVAITLEANPGQPDGPGTEMLGYWASSDAYHPLSVPADGRGIRACLDKALTKFHPTTIGGVCPHATGTDEQGRVEQHVLSERLDSSPRILLKPFTGHALGASGLLEIALLADFLKHGQFPQNLPHLTGANLPTSVTSINDQQILLKMASGMGGHNAVVALRRHL